MGPLIGETALVTGANRGLGKVIARKLIEQGANVFLCARDRKALRETFQELRAACPTNQSVGYAACDVRVTWQILAAVHMAVKVTERLDILVCSAGIYGPIGLTENVALVAWQDTIATNLLGTVAFCQEVTPVMRKQGYGKLILISGGGATSPLPHFAAYAASKAGVVAFSATLAEELKGSGVDVNAVSPGPLNTRLIDQVIEAGPDRAGAEFYERMVEFKQAGVDSRDRAASLVAFLASHECDGISGRLISAVWDDWENLPNERDTLRESDKYTLRRVT